jgi:SAM-dependent methyltransferase
MRRPRFIAEQARHAKGMLGRAIAFIMARETWAQNRRAIKALGVGKRDRVIDIGCGPGRSLKLLAKLASRGQVVGADPSELMAEIAVRRNRAGVKTNRVKVVIASAASLPFEDDSFDKALCVHVLYFWNDLAAGFRDVARVLKPGGRLALVFRTDADTAAVQAFPADVYRFPARSAVIASLAEAGFAVETIDERRRTSKTPPALLIATKAEAQGSLGSLPPVARSSGSSGS